MQRKTRKMHWIAADNRRRRKKQEHIGEIWHRAVDPSSKAGTWHEKTWFHQPDSTRSQIRCDYTISIKPPHHYNSKFIRIKAVHKCIKCNENIKRESQEEKKSLKYISLKVYPIMLCVCCFVFDSTYMVNKDEYNNYSDITQTPQQTR